MLSSDAVCINYIIHPAGSSIHLSHNFRLYPNWDLNPGPIFAESSVLPIKLWATDFTFFAEGGYSLPIEYYDSKKGRLSDSYSVIGQVWMLFIVTMRGQ